MTLLQGLRGAALEFANILPADVQGNFKGLSMRLIDRFPHVRNEFDGLKGTRSLEEYGNAARGLGAQVGEASQPALARAWVAGLTDQIASSAAQLMLAEQSQRGEAIRVEESINLISTATRTHS
ncbi:hypothetical protein N7491_001982 [Penicillium cf. griseofulvum]|uniref:Uncharacterized protein n=1 Tax=Penicillium cf. griseofulvum TaxID=2972120 RepID=A0A9W9MTT7_9EURO|nr:hypothetical protein N7472_003833 [Penicillium cf. griseofulvum]KAJ5445900.1 hypothetical protein N7491_001982 [Penicillium cf. griseofulvum]